MSHSVRLPDMRQNMITFTCNNLPVAGSAVLWNSQFASGANPVLTLLEVFKRETR
jgi:hypothetical protein